MDVIALFGRTYSYAKAIRSGDDKFAFKTLWSAVILGKEHISGISAEYANLVVEDPEELDEAELKVKEVDHPSSGENSERHSAEVVFDEHGEDRDGTAQWANDVRRHRRNHSYAMSAASDRTLFTGGPRPPRRDSDDSLHETGGSWLSWLPRNRATFLRRFGRAAFATAERVLVFAGFMQVLTGIVEYTGGCRQNWLNGCLAHLISELTLNLMYSAGF